LLPSAKCTRPLFQGRTGCGGRPSGWHDIVTCQHLVLCIESPTELSHYISSNSVNLCSDTRLRSASRSDYNVPTTYWRFTNSSFSISPPTVWNCLPIYIRSSPTFSSFLTRLKTHLSIPHFLPFSTYPNLIL